MRKEWKKIIIAIGLFGAALALSSGARAEVSPQVEEGGGLEEFLIEKIIPAFGGLDEIIFSNEPNFDFTITASEKPFNLISCGAKLKLKQVKLIETEKFVIPVPTGNLDGSVNIPQMKTLNLQVSCLDESPIPGTFHFRAEAFITDGNDERSNYPLSLTLVGKEQAQAKFQNIEMDVNMSDSNISILKSVNGEIIVLEDHHEALKDRSGIYKMPVSDWLSHPETSAKLPRADKDLQYVTLERSEVIKLIELNGEANVKIFRVINDGSKDFADMKVRVSGSVFMTDKGETLPFIRIRN